MALWECADHRPQGRQDQSVGLHPHTQAFRLLRLTPATLHLFYLFHLFIHSSSPTHLDDHDTKDAAH